MATPFISKGSLKPGSLKPGLTLRKKVTMATPSIAKVSLKLLIDTKGNRVLFAEAGKDFVDFLFNLLLLPLGTVVRLITEQQSPQTMVGTLGNIYESIQNMSETYFPSNQTKDSLLKPEVPIFSATQVPLLPLAGNQAGFVKGMVTYMVTDDLVVTPAASPISSMTMLMDRFNVKEMGAVEERVVDLRMPEALKLLKASLQTKKVLTSAFLGNTGY